MRKYFRKKMAWTTNDVEIRAPNTRRADRFSVVKTRSGRATAL